jgi:hypothetical protein
MVMRPLTALAGIVAALALWPSAANAMPAAGITATGDLAIFDTTAPATILGRHPITGLQPGEIIVAIDARPATGGLYGLAISGAGPDSGRIYTLDPGTGAAAPVGTAPFSTTLPHGASYGFDFSPVADRIRIVSSSDTNLRVNPDTGALMATDTPLSGSNGVSAIAYDSNSPGAADTTLFGYARTPNKLVRIGDYYGSPASPNGGQVSAFGASGVTFVSPRVGFDIAPDGSGFVSGNPAGSTYALYRVNFANATLGLIANFPEEVDDVAILQRSSFQLDGSSIAVAEDAGTATVTVIRSGNASGTQTVAYSTSDGSAGVDDYTAASGTLTFGPGVTRQTFAVPVVNDGVDEPPETVNLALSSPSLVASLGSPAAGTLTILDDDPPFGGAAGGPQILLSLPTQRSVRKLKAGLRGSFSCSEACLAVFDLRYGSRELGRVNASLPAAGVGSFRVKVGSSGIKALRRRLKHHRSAQVVLKSAAANAGGKVRRTSARVTVTR